MEQLGTFTGHTPPQLMERNAALGKFLRVLDAMQALKGTQVETFDAHFDPRRTEDVGVLRRYVDEFSGEYRPDTPAASLECLFLHKGLIYGQKGTEKGLVQWLRCITQARRVLVTYESPYPFLHFHTLAGGVLPNGEDLYNEMERGFKIPTLLADSWLLGYSGVTVTLYGAYNETPEFAAWLVEVLPKYLPMTDGAALNAEIIFLPATAA